MKLVLIILLFCSNKVFAEQYQSSYSVGEDEYLIKVGRHSNASSEEVTVKYQVFLNNRELDDYAYPGSVSNAMQVCDSSEVAILPVSSKSVQLGWMLVSSGEKCNIEEKSVLLAIPFPQGTNKKIKGTAFFYSKAFLSLDVPLINPIDSGAEIWFYKGLSANKVGVENAIVARKYEIEFLPLNANIYSGDVLKNIEFLIKSSKEINREPDFLSFFVAGIRDAHPELIDFAVERFYEKTLRSRYEQFIPDSSLEAVKKLTGEIRQVRHVFLKYFHLTEWGIPLRVNDRQGQE